jgi:hypothetical protein
MMVTPLGIRCHAFLCTEYLWNYYLFKYYHASTWPWQDISYVASELACCATHAPGSGGRRSQCQEHNFLSAQLLCGLHLHSMFQESQFNVIDFVSIVLILETLACIIQSDAALLNSQYLFQLICHCKDTQYFLGTTNDYHSIRDHAPTHHSFHSGALALCTTIFGASVRNRYLFS